MKYARSDETGTIYAGLPFGQYDPQAGLVLQQATPSPTATITPTLTATSTLSPTPTVTVTATLTPTLTPSSTATVAQSSSPTVSPSPTGPPTEAVTDTPDLVGTLLDMPTELAATAEEGQGATPVDTPTYIPFPKITIVALAATGTDVLNYLQAPPGSNRLLKGEVSTWMKLRKFWPLAVILAFWLGLAVWFLVVRLLDRN